MTCRHGVQYAKDCKQCGAQYRATYEAKPEKAVISKKAKEEWRSKNLDRAHRQEKTWRDTLRQSILEAYGAVCVCCGETNEVFLEVDHVHGGGSAHRRSVASTYRAIRNEGFPPTYRILCRNCNWGYYRCGVCPHQSTTTSMEN